MNIINNKNYRTPSAYSLDKVYKRGYNEKRDPFLEGFNSGGTVKKNQKRN